MNNPVLVAVENFQKDLQQGLVNQTMIASMENFLGENFITSEHSIKNFTQHKSGTNIELAVKALEDYKAKLINSSIVSAYDNVRLDKIELLNGRVSDFLSYVRHNINYAFTLEEMRSLLIGYNELFLTSRDNMVSDSTYTIGKNVGYIDYVIQFSRMMSSADFLEEYSKRLHGIISSRDNTVTIEKVTKVAKNKFYKIREILGSGSPSSDDPGDMFNGFEFGGYTPKNELPIRIYSPDLDDDSKVLTVEEMIEKIDPSNPCNLLKECDKFVSNIRNKNYHLIGRVLDDVKDTEIKASGHPFPYLSAFMIIVSGYAS